MKRDYEDDVRLYMPVLQRIIILVAVIVAVPVVLWTITSLVRTYVGPPRLPTFQRLAAVPPPDSAANTSNSTANPAPTSVPTIAASNAAPSAPPASDQTGNIPVQQPMTVATAGQPAIGPPAGASPVPAQAVPAQQAPPMPAVSSAAPSGAATGSALNASPPSFAWPNSPLAPTASNMAASSAPPDAQASSNDTSDALPAAAPIQGPVPVPRRRPNAVAMISAASPVGLPLPRARPAEALATPPDTAATNVEPNYNFGGAH